MAVKIQTGTLGFTIEVDGNISEAHRYDHAAVVKGPSGKLYCAYITQGPMGKPTGKPQAYMLTPVGSIHIDKPLPADEVGGEYVEDDIYEDDESEGEDEEEEGGEEDGEEGEEGEEFEEDDDPEGEEGDDEDEVIIQAS